MQKGNIDGSMFQYLARVLIDLATAISSEDWKFRENRNIKFCIERLHFITEMDIQSAKCTNSSKFVTE
jgi:hypothetical protein